MFYEGSINLNAGQIEKKSTIGRKLSLEMYGSKLRCAVAFKFLFVENKSKHPGHNDCNHCCMGQHVHMPYWLETN